MNTQGVGDCSDALCSVSSFAIRIDTAQLVAGEAQARQPACDARAEHLGDQLDTSRADVLVRHVHRHDLAVLVAADCGKDGTPALFSELVAPELDGRQPAIDAQSVGNRCDALCNVGAAVGVVVGVPILINAAQQVV